MAPNPEGRNGLTTRKLFGREVFFDIGLVFGGQDDLLNSGALGGQDLFLDSTYGQHISA